MRGADDDSSSSDSSSDDSENSSLHASSGPIMGGKGPGQLDWMNKFARPTGKAKNPPTPSVAGNIETTKSTGVGRPAPERRTVTPTSSFSRGETDKPAQPEWMAKFQKIGQKSSSPESRERSPSPTRETVQSQVIMPTAPTTPGWMKQYRKGPAVAGAPKVPMLPPMPPLPPASTPAPEVSTSKKGKGKSSKKDWKALLNNSKTPSSGDAEVVNKQPEPKKVTAPETPQWMNKFTTAGKGLPMAPNMDGMDSDDDQSVTSMASTASVEPDWMSQFNKVKPGRNTVEPKKIKPPSARSKKADEPEWIQKFQRRNSNHKIDDAGGPVLETVEGIASPTGRGSSVSLASKQEPEWMARYREIGVDDVEESPVRSKPKYSVVPRMNAPSADLRKSTGPSPHVPQESNNSFSDLELKRAIMSSPPGKKAGNSSFSGGLFVSGMIFPSGGMVSAPASPTTSGKVVVGGGLMSAPSSPIGGAGTILGGPGFAMSPGRPAVLQQRMQLDPPAKTMPAPKAIDPAAMTPEKPAWMSKVKAVAHSTKQQPEWMVKLKRRKQGLDEPGPRKGTPPWKRRERLKEEQAQRLREETGMLPHYDDTDKEANMNDGSAEKESDEVKNVHGGDISDEEANEDEEEENVPEWMRQFKKMHLKEAEVLSALGRAPQGISRLRRGSMQMIERNNLYNPANEAVRAIPTVLPKSKKETRRREKKRSGSGEANTNPNIDAPVSNDLGSSKHLIDTATPDRDETEKELEKSLRVLKYVQNAHSPPPTTERKTLEESEQAKEDLEGDSNDPPGANASNATTSYMNQVEIDNTKPDNVMSMWGTTVKAKKPGNSTLMSFRMIQNQAETVKERIARAKQQAEGGEESDEESIKGIEEINETASVGLDNSAAALFGFGGGAGSSTTNTRESVTMDNSAAALFGFGAKPDSPAKTTRDSVSMDNSASALFGFGAGSGSSEKDSSASMDNSAAALFGFGKANESSSSIDMKCAADSSKSMSMDNSAAAMFQRQSIAEGSGNESDSSSNEEKKKVDEEEPESEKKKSLLHESDSDSDDSSDAFKKRKEQPSKMKSAPALVSLGFDKKKSFLDDSDSDDSSDDEKPKREPAANKKSFLNDSDDDSSDDEKPKVPSSAPRLPVTTKKALSDDSDDDENAKSSAKDTYDQKSNEAPAPTPKKKSFLNDSDSEDSDDEKPKLAPIKLATPAYEETPDSDPDDSSTDRKKVAPPKSKSPTPPAVSSSFAASKEKSSLDDSSSDSDSDGSSAKRRKAPPKAESPPPPPPSLPSSSKKISSPDDGSSSDADSDSSADRRKKKPLPKSKSPPLSSTSAVTTKSKKKDDASSSDSDSESSSSSGSSVSSADRKKKKKSSPKKAESPPPAATSKPSFVFDTPALIDKPPDPVEEKAVGSGVDGWGAAVESEEKPAKDEDAAWQAALEELAAEETAKKEKAEQDAWQAALEGLAAEETKKTNNEQDAWDAALQELAADEAILASKSQESDRSKNQQSKGKDDDNNKSIGTDDDSRRKTKGKGKGRERESKKKVKDSDRDSDSKKGKDSKSKKDSDKKRDKDRNPSKSPKSKKKELKKPPTEASPFDSSPFGASPFGASPFGGASPFDPIGSNGSSGDPSPFAPLGSNGTSSDPSPFAPLGSQGTSSDPSPFAPLGSSGASGASSPFAPLSSNGTSNDPSPFDPVGLTDGSFSPVGDKDKKKSKNKGLAVKDAKPKKPKSSMKLVVQTAKPKGNLHEKRKKKKGKHIADDNDDDDDDSFGNMEDFDDNFSVANDFGDFAEDRSVVPLRAVRNPVLKAKKSTFSPKPPRHGSTKVKPNLLAKKSTTTHKDSKDPKGKDKEKKSRSRSKSVTKSKSRSRSKSAEKTKSRSRSKSADKKHSRSRSKSAEKKKSRSRSKSAGRKKDDSRGRSRSTGRSKSGSRKGRKKDSS